MVLIVQDIHDANDIFNYIGNVNNTVFIDVVYNCCNCDKINI